MGYSKSEVMKQESKGLMENEIIRPGKPKRVRKSPWECGVRKWVKDAQGKQMGQGCSRRKKWDKRAHKQCNGLRKPKVV